MRRSYFQGGSTGPITHFRGLPVYGATIIAAVHLTTFLFSALLGARALERVLGFSTSLVLDRFEFWRIFTYGFANDILGYSPIWFVIGLVFFFFFGREVEMLLGRKAFFGLYAAIWLSVPAVLLLFNWLTPSSAAGSNIIHLGVFVAFATIYPGVAVFFSIPAKWMAIGYVTVVGLRYVAARQADGLMAVAAVTLAAFFGTLHLTGRIEIHWPEWMRRLGSWLTPSGRRRAKLRVMPKVELDDGSEDVDSILDKIAAKGMSSLSARERDILQRARANLLEREKK